MRLPRVRSKLSQAWMCVLMLALFFVPAHRAFALDPDKTFDQYVASNWSVQNGLPQISVLSIAQDNSGYLWVGTQGGLTRFDGVRFTSFTPDTEPQLPGIWIRALMADRKGNIWIGTYKGLAVYADGHFTSVPPADSAAHPSLDVFALAQSGNGDIIAATSDGLLRVANGKLVTIDSSAKPALSLLVRSDGMWIGTTGAVVHLSAGQSIRIPLPDNAASAAVTRVVESAGRTWVGTSQGLFVNDGGAWVPFDGDPALTSTPIAALFEDGDHNLWVGTNSALIRLRGNRVAESVTSGPTTSYKNVTSAFEDREGNLWLGSQVNGLTRLWNGWTRRYSVNVGLSDPVVWSLSHGPDGSLWVGSSDGLSVLEFGRFRTIALGSALPNPQAYNLLAEADRVWIGTRRGLAIWQDGKIDAPQEFAPMARAQINGIVREPDGALWFPTSEGLFRIEHEGLPDEHLHRYAQEAGLSDIRVRVMQYLHDGRLLVGTQSGLFELNGDRFAPLGVDAGLPRNIDITGIYQLPSGAIMTGTFSEQMFLFDGNRWKQLGPEQGLPANTPFFMTVDDRGFLWIAGIRGIERVPLADLVGFASGVLRNVRGEMVLNERGDTNAGQQGFCCNGAGMSKGFIDGHVLWLPSRDGVVALDTHGIAKNPVAPNVVIERVEYKGAWHATTDMPKEIESDARDLVFEFTAPSFQDPHSVQMRYRLVGYDQAWHVLDDPIRRRANYTNLPPGDYTFEVMGANNAGVWNPAPAQLAFRIHPYFHETPLFRILVALLFGLLVYAGYHRQRQLHRIQRASLEKQVYERNQQLHIANERLENASQSDPLTGLRNRRYLANQIPVDLAYYDREQQRDAQSELTMLFAMVRIDAAGADAGEPIGDRVLQQFAQVLISLVRNGDYIARWGDAEFLIVFRPMHSRHLAAIGERMRMAVRSHAFDGGTGAALELACSIGLAEYPLYRDATRRPGWEQLVGLAHAAMMWVASHGSDGWAALRPSLRTDLSDTLRELHDDPQPMIDNGRLHLIGSHVSGHSDVHPLRG